MTTTANKPTSQTTQLTGVYTLLANWLTTVSFLLLCITTISTPPRHLMATNKNSELSVHGCHPHPPPPPSPINQEIIRKRFSKDKKTNKQKKHVPRCYRHDHRFRQNSERAHTNILDRLKKKHEVRYYHRHCGQSRENSDSAYKHTRLISRLSVGHSFVHQRKWTQETDTWCDLPCMYVPVRTSIVLCLYVAAAAGCTGAATQRTISPIPTSNNTTKRLAVCKPWLFCCKPWLFVNPIQNNAGLTCS